MMTPIFQNSKNVTPTAGGSDTFFVNNLLFLVEKPETARRSNKKEVFSFGATLADVW